MFRLIWVTLGGVVGSEITNSQMVRARDAVNPEKVWESDIKNSLLVEPVINISPLYLIILKPRKQVEKMGG